MDSYIAVDWGSTHLRAWRFAQGKCIDRLHLPGGVAQLASGEAPALFARHIAPWRQHAAIPVVMAGMIGSDAGWCPVPYLSCPASLHEVAAQLRQVEEQIWIVPGLKLECDGEYSVMRGEETQLFGAMQLARSDCYVMPGTHSKWVNVTGERIVRFSTAMTGELYHLLMNHSLIGKGLPAQQPDDAAFTEGLERGLAAPSLVDELFTARAARVLGALAAASVGEMLSGLLIGAEAAAFSRQFRPQQVTLVASPPLGSRYQQAFARLGITVTPCDGEKVFLEGVRRIIDVRR